MSVKINALLNAFQYFKNKKAKNRVFILTDAQATTTNKLNRKLMNFPPPSIVRGGRGGVNLKKGNRKIPRKISRGEIKIF